MSGVVRYCLLFAVLFLLKNGVVAQTPIRNAVNFERDQIVAWCIVPFDIKMRGPEERSQMLNDLGITKLAYDWRDHHIPEFDEEINTLRKHHIYLQAFWLMSDTGITNNARVDAVFSVLRRKQVITQIWYLFAPSQGFDLLTQEQKVKMAAKTVSEIAKRADSIGCSIGLYNHNGWFGEPENQLAILATIKMKNVGMVYNFNHAQDHTERFEKFYPLIQPYLIAINLAGLKKGDSRIYPISKSGAETKMIDIILKSKYKGPIGIINEDTDPDAAVGLQKNTQGLKEILAELGYQTAADSYTP